MATKTTVPTPAERAAEHERRIRELTPHWTRYGRVQPLAAGAVAVGGQGFDLSLLTEKFTLAVELDLENIGLEAAKGDQARERLGELNDPDDLAALQRAEADAATRAAAAEDAHRAARVAHADHHAALARRKERIAAARADADAADAARRRWEAELERDRGHLANVTLQARLLEVTA